VSEETRITDPNTGGQKGQKLERYDLIPPEPLDRLARHYGIGALKYTDDNWLKGYSWRLSIGAMLRHTFAFLRGESIDGETGSHHLTAAIWHCIALQEFERLGLGTDDRYGHETKNAHNAPGLGEGDTIYIAGPMRGIARYNFPAFDRAAEDLVKCGWQIKNPAQLDRDAGFDPVTLPSDHNWHTTPPGFDFPACRRRDIEAIEKSDAMYMLKGWSKSTGAQAEHAYATWMGIPIYGWER